MKKQLWLFTIGGAVYYLLELFWKGSSHWSMFVVGGICFRAIGMVRVFLSQLNVLWQCLICGTLITAVEFFSGCFINLRLHLFVWDYSALPMNLLGQICLPFTMIWSALSFFGLQADRILNKKFSMSKTKPQIIIHELSKIRLH